MRHATWLKVEASPVWLDLYRQYRRLPPALRAPLRVLATPQWHLAAYLVRAASRNRVVAGPFRGMRLRLSDLSSRHLLGYLLGSQERELHEVIERIVERRYATIVNVGAADRYYTIGLALRAPTSRVETFEAVPELHPGIDRSARLNGVSDRLATFGRCDTDALRASLQRAEAPALIVMDIEGGEIDLLDLQAVPELAHADILVETHDQFVRNATDTLIERFWQTHNAECYTAQLRILGDFPPGFLSILPRWLPRLAVDLMDERRPGVQRWLFLPAKCSASREPGDGRSLAVPAAG
jgi:hypothetical protein